MTAMSIDKAIHAAAIERYRCDDVSVVKQTVSDYKDPIDKGDWFVLSLKRGNEWEVKARRRTKQELWQMIKAD